MSGSPSDRPLHGGAGRVVALAVRAMGYQSGAAVVIGGPGRPAGAAAAEPRRVVAVGSDDQALLAASAAVVDGRLPDDPGVLAVPLIDTTGVVGALCVGGPPDGADPVADLAVLQEFASVLHDQLDLLRRLGPPPEAEAVDRFVAALDAGEVRAWFQPIVRLDDEALVGFEALARWRTADGELVRPGDFVPLAEQTGLVTRLDLVVLRDAVAQLSRWHRTHPDLRLSANISGRHLDDEGWGEAVHAVVSAAGVRTDRVELELTESARPSDVLRSVDELRDLRELGYEIWFDDFGTGWSELRQLVELPVDGVKIDRFFTEALGGRGDSVVRAMLQIADDLGLDTVIEGVSQPAHATRARELGCLLGQGFLWSPAVPADEVDAVLSAGTGFRAAAR